MNMNSFMFFEMNVLELCDLCILKKICFDLLSEKLILVLNNEKKYLVKRKFPSFSETRRG